MQPLSSFNNNLGTAILLVGGAGVGKTSLAGRLFPKTAFVVADLNFRSGLDYWKKIGCLDNIVGYETPALTPATATPIWPNGQHVVVNQQYARLVKIYDEFMKDPNVDAIASDSVTFFEDIIKAKICMAQSMETIKLTNFDMWGLYLMTWKSLIIQLRQSGKKIIFTSHESKEKDESDNAFKYQIAVDGQIRSKFPAIFSDVWRCERKEVNGKHEYLVRTLGNGQQEHLKNTYGMDPVLSHDDVIKKVRGEK